MFVGLSDQIWSFPDGIIDEDLENSLSISKVFDVLWSPASQHLAAMTGARESTLQCDKKTIDLFLASILVTGLSPSPEIEFYFKQDSTGIFGNKWMQDHFTAKKWHELNSHIHLDPLYLCDILRENYQKIYSPQQILVVDEMMMPFQGRWKSIQHVRGKPHNTGLNSF